MVWSHLHLQALLHKDWHPSEYAEFVEHAVFLAAGLQQLAVPHYDC